MGEKGRKGGRGGVTVFGCGAECKVMDDYGWLCNEMAKCSTFPSSFLLNLLPNTSFQLIYTG